jgi:S1-C subfamily serine protease
MIDMPRVGAWLVIIALAAGADPAAAETVGQVFRRVNASVVVVRTRERDVLRQSDASPATVAGLGSGVVIDARGYVLTAAHVVQTADEIVVEFLDGHVATARVVGSEPEADLALIQLEPVRPGMQVAVLGDSDAVDVGDQVFVVGAPYGIGHTLTVGHVSARHKPNTVYSGMSLAEFLQTDTAINHGNSGGPLFSLRGEVVGIVSHIISKSGGFEGLGFVVTSNMARRLLLERRSFWTGVDGYVLGGELARILNLPQPVGLLVQRVAAHSPAARAGLLGGSVRATIAGETLTVGGDIVLEVQGLPITGRSSYEAIQARLSQLHPGVPVTITVLRGGRRVDLVGRLP